MTALRRLALVPASLLVGGLALLSGCSGAADDASSGSSAGALTRSIEPSHLLDDSDVQSDGSITGDQVQAVLEAEGGYLSTYAQNGKRAADIIADECAKNGIHPGYMLARIQGESGLVTGGTTKSLAHATGCACPDGAACSSSEAGFQQQVQCTAESMAGYFTAIASDGKTISGWGPGITKKTFDPCTVKPDNAATAAMYTYTPWVGSYGAGCGTSKSGGSSEVAMMTKSFGAKIAAGASGS